MSENIERFIPQNRQDWREWLSRNHEKVKSVWLVFFKKNSGVSTLSYEEAVEEALCFGWIDSKPNRLDESRYLLKFTQRRPKSVWAKSNKERVSRLIKQGLMTEAGLRVIERAKKDGSWDSINDIEDLVLPRDLKSAIQSDKAAWKNYQALSDSKKKQFLWWMAGAKHPETRQKRMELAVRALENDPNPKPWNN